ncbi:hypothetical protein QFZ58_002214 [Streptomyces sp. B1I3]|nr:hypothetical protein [Streptomyces sp. B1I3]
MSCPQEEPTSMSRTTISVRHTDVTREQLAEIQRMTGSMTTAEVLTQALDLYLFLLENARRNAPCGDWSHARPTDARGCHA